MASMDINQSATFYNIIAECVPGDALAGKFAAHYSKGFMSISQRGRKVKTDFIFSGWYR